MGFMDKVKAQATVLAEKAQEGAKAGQEKLSSMQAKRQSDAMLLEIGGLLYSQRVGRADSGAEAKIDSLVSRLSDFETEHGQIQVTPADGQTGASGSFVPSSSGAGTGESVTAEATATDGPSASSAPPAAPAPGGGGGGGIPMASYASDEEQEEA